MKNLKMETYVGTTWCAGLHHAQINTGDTVFRDHVHHHVYCSTCAKEADHRVAVQLWEARRNDVITALKKLHGEDATLPLDAITALLPEHPEWSRR